LALSTAISSSALLLLLWGLVAVDEFEQLSHCEGSVAKLDDRVMKIHSIPVAAPYFLSLDISLRLKVTNDLPGRTFGYSHRLGDI
jgi:hypothetical protein